MSDLDTLSRLNAEYIRSVQESDTRCFGEMLAEDFLNTNPDGSLLDKPGFLKQIAPKTAISNLRCHDVNVRLMGDFAIIHARTSYTKPDGKLGGGRYTDIWARRGGQWLCVAAQVARN
jgi:ketosteroid isomerase-like protein